MIKFVDKLKHNIGKKSSKKSPSVQNISQIDNSPTELFEQALKSDLKLIDIINENLACTCCLEIIKSPVTLECGHSFCQLCLANWFVSSTSRECPMCRQAWQTVPKISNMLKTTTQQLINYELTQANSDATFKALNDYILKCDKLTEDEKKLIKKFEDQAKRPLLQTQLASSSTILNNLNDRGAEIRNATRRPSENACYFFYGLVFGLIVSILFVVLVWLFLSIGSRALTKSPSLTDSFASLRKKYSKPVEKWSFTETQEWLYQLGPWTSDVARVAQNLKIGKNRIYNWLI